MELIGLITGVQETETIIWGTGKNGNSNFCEANHRKFHLCEKNKLQVSSPL